jgi:osmotically-inducible protein OsmY
MRRNNPSITNQELRNMIQINGEFDEYFDQHHDGVIEQQVRAFLDGHHVPSLRRLVVSVVGGTVTLQGNVRTFYEKQLSHQCLRRIAGIRRLIDQTVVLERRV